MDHSDHINKREASHHRSQGGHSMERDINAAELAWDLWKSGCSADWDRALRLKDEVIKRNPRAWEYAMKEVNTAEAVERRLPPALRTFQEGERRGLRLKTLSSGEQYIGPADDPYACERRGWASSARNRFSY